MATRLLQEAEVSLTSVRVKFNYTIDITSFSNDAFVLTTTSPSASTVSNPFEAINLSRDYNSIGRILTLHFSDELAPNTTYRLTISGLETVSGDVIDDDYFEFITDEDTDSAPEDLIPEQELYVVQDYSIKTVSSATVITELSDELTEDGFGILSIDPDESISYYLANDYNNGVITITFSRPINVTYVDPQYFKVQRKAITRGMSRWEDVDATVEFGTSHAEIVVSLPSLDDTPVYDTDGSDYWESEYKYRLRISSSVADDSATPSSLVAEKEYTFLSELDPLYVDVDKVKLYYSEVVLTEATEIIYNYSLEVQGWFGENLTLTQLMHDYILAATLCDLSKIYVFGGGLGGFSVSDQFTLGDLSVTSSSGGSKSKSALYRGNASSWCELASLYREELLMKNVGMKGVYRGINVDVQIPSRKLKRLD